MRTETPAQAKGGRYSNMNRHALPKEGTRIRRLYDLLMANKGIPIDVSITMIEGRNRSGRTLSDLIDYYGLDIRKIHNGRWVLAGEWNGLRYRDYIAERIAEMDAKRK